MKQLVPALLLALAACGGSPAPAPSPAAAPTAPTEPAPAPTPTSWKISGRIVTSTDLGPLTGVGVRFGDDTPTMTDGTGAFAVITTDSTTKPLVVTAPGFLTRETSLTGGVVRSDVQIDLLASDPAFPLQQYRDVVRNAYERPNNPEPSRHWTTDPNVFIVTKWRDSGADVDPAFVDYLVSEVRRFIPAWSDGRLKLGAVETPPTDRPLQKGWIKVQFGRSGNWSLLGEDPGWVQFGSEGMCQSIAIAHEFGHAMGYWHTRVRPSIMGGGPGTCSPTNLSTNELQIARAMYGRAPGNVEPDRDGPPPPPAPIFAPTLAGPQAAASPLLSLCDALLRR